MPSLSRTLSLAVNCDRSETRTKQAMIAESEFLFRCYSPPDYYRNLRRIPLFAFTRK